MRGVVAAEVGGEESNREGSEEGAGEGRPVDGHGAGWMDR